MEARAAWVRETAAAWREAVRAMDERCSEAVGRIPSAHNPERRPSRANLEAISFTEYVGNGRLSQV